jgi:hypothetical protein
MSQLRRSFLDDLPPAPQEHVHHIPATATSTSNGKRRPGRAPAHKRDRNWESKHPPTTFVGVPEEIRKAIRNLSAYYRQECNMRGGVDAVARELLSYALKAYAEGRIDMRPAHRQPQSQLRANSNTIRKPKTIPARPSAPKKKERLSASYRLPADQVEKIGTIIQLEEYKASPHVIELTRGQVVTRLFSYALEAYQTGDLELEPDPESVGIGLKARAVR